MKSLLFFSFLFLNTQVIAQLKECRAIDRQCPQLVLLVRGAQRLAATGFNDPYASSKYTVTSTETRPTFRAGRIRVGDRLTLIRESGNRGCQGEVIEEITVDRLDNEDWGYFFFQVSNPLPYTTTTQSSGELGFDTYRITKNDLCPQRGSVEYRLIKDGYNLDNPSVRWCQSSEPGCPQAVFLIDHSNNKRAPKLDKIRYAYRSGNVTSDERKPLIAVGNVEVGNTLTLFRGDFDTTYRKCNGEVIGRYTVDRLDHKGRFLFRPETPLPYTTNPPRFGGGVSDRDGNLVGFDYFTIQNNNQCPRLDTLAYQLVKGEDKPAGMEFCDGPSFTREIGCPRLYINFTPDRRAPTGQPGENVRQTGGFFKSDERYPLLAIDGLRVGDRVRFYRAEKTIEEAVQCIGQFVQEEYVNEIGTNRRGTFMFKVKVPLPYTTISYLAMSGHTQESVDKMTGWSGEYFRTKRHSLGYDRYFVTRVTPEGKELCSRRNFVLNYQLISVANGFDPKNPVFAPRNPPELLLIHSGGTAVNYSSSPIVINSGLGSPTIWVRNIPIGSTVTIYEKAGCRGRVLNADASKEAKAKDYYYRVDLAPGTYSFSVHASGMQQACSTGVITYTYSPQESQES